MGLSSLHNLPTSNDPYCVLACRASGAARFPVTVTPIPGCGSLVDHHHATPRIFVAQAGFGRRRYQRGLRTMDLQIAPRMIEVYEADLTFDHVSWSGEAGRCVQVEFRDADVMAMTHGDLRALALRTQQDVQSVRLDAAARALRAADVGAISAIAGACGFASQSHLTEVMRRHIGITPSAMRRGRAQAADLGVAA